MSGDFRDVYARQHGAPPTPDHFRSLDDYRAWMAGTPRAYVGRNRLAISFAKRVRIYSRDGYRCSCGATRQLELDHRVPLAFGGSNRDVNLVTSCAGCNVAGWERDYRRLWESCRAAAGAR